LSKPLKKQEKKTYWKLQDITIFDAKKRSKCVIIRGNQQIANPNTIAMDIFNTFRSL